MSERPKSAIVRGFARRPPSARGKGGEEFRPAPGHPITVPVHEVECYLANGWRLTDEPHCSGAQMVPPERFLGDDPPPDPPQMRSPPIRQDERANSQGGVFSKNRLLPAKPICKTSGRIAPPNVFGRAALVSSGAV